MVIGHLQHHTSPRVIVECPKERGDVTNVIDDVVCGYDVSTRRHVGHSRPEALDCLTGDPTRPSVNFEHLEHVGLVIHTDHVSSRRYQRERGNAAATAHVQHAAPFAKHFARPIVRRRSFDDLRDLEERRRMNPRTLLGRGQYVVGDGPRVK